MKTPDVRVKLNSAAVIALMQSAGIAADIGGRTEAIAAAAGPGFEATVTTNRDRVVGFVRTETPEARKAEAEHRALSKAIDSGR
ncbi:hypothetical protein A9Z40_03125 [Microbacterium arborescens]|uniref:Uncharacterized protein n=1 Tax=Microbacterium arborescens TaxID=33883 RepID=A0ABX2WIA1_9MICO|nr:hypothetical protein [Microbacterium arborescens]OAZ40947.1 hypothetical protein A9Z40_03125 [Microbacterium arborescens]